MPPIVNAAGAIVFGLLSIFFYLDALRERFNNRRYSAAWQRFVAALCLTFLSGVLAWAASMAFKGGM